MTESSKKPLPAVDFLKIPESGEPYLEGHKCKCCGHLPRRAHHLLEVRHARHDRRRQLSNEDSSTSTRSCTARSPEISRPYVSAIVDLEGGGTVKGNLIGVEPDPAKIQIGMPVEVGVQGRPRSQGPRRQLVPLVFLPARQSLRIQP